MAQPFSPRSNALSRLIILIFLGLILGSFAFATIWTRTDYPYAVDMPIEQPVPFSHKHHVQGLGLDCRFCHFSVERSAEAGFPDTRTCMTCHFQIYAGAKVLASVRKSFETGEPLRWIRVHRLPDYVFFDHSIHVNKGVGCVTCHGNVSQMASVARVERFRMRDCVDCHNAPESHLRPLTEITNETWRPKSSAETDSLARAYGIERPRLTDCNTCHR